MAFALELMRFSRRNPGPPREARPGGRGEGVSTWRLAGELLQITFPRRRCAETLRNTGFPERLCPIDCPGGGDPCGGARSRALLGS